MTQLRQLAGQTAIYGTSTIFGRLLNYALVPFYTYIFGNPADFGLNTEFYAYISFLNILFAYGMETALFNFSSSEQNKELVYSTSLRSLLVSSILLSLPVVFFAGQIAETLRYPGHADFVRWAILIVATDALTAIPFARLREQNKARRFATIKLLNIIINLAINFFFIGWCKWEYENNTGSALAELYDPSIGIGYAFIANLAANVFTLMLLSPELTKIRYGFDAALWKRMMRYSLPLLVVGFAGMTNETLDRILIKYLLPPGIGEEQLGIYGACYKISILMTIFIQAFRYAAEPFFFSRREEEGAPALYGKIMKYFVVFCLLIFIGTSLNLSWIQLLVGEEYRSGIAVVPILLLANLFLGMYFNLSIWYKLTGRTRFGMWLTLVGAAITLVLNFRWIPSAHPVFGGYMGSAWATLICYGTMMILSYIIGQRYYRVKYDVPRILGYIALAVLLFLAGKFIAVTGKYWLDLLLNNLLVFAYFLIVVLAEKPFRQVVKHPR
ncbi:MAG TPA: oligosaccharide flippase family protein [Bacteroidia bacterium]|nr:oligosaccharide flippase family protein [Bacteroidia bacterium]